MAPQDQVQYYFQLAHQYQPVIRCFFTVDISERYGPDTPDAIRQRDTIFRFSLTDNFDPSLNFPNI
jgi:hypothetical protein